MDSGREAVTYPHIDQDVVHKVVSRHGLKVDSSDLWVPPPVGTINSAVVIGNRFVLRVPKATADGVSDTLTEAVAVPVASAVGILTPRLVVFDNSCELFDVPYTVQEFVDGSNLALSSDPFAVPQWEAAYRELGRQLALLHTSVTDCPDPEGWLDSQESPTSDQFDQLLEALQRSGWLARSTRNWLSGWLRAAEPVIRSGAIFRRFLHGDVAATNVLVSEQRLAALIDWGDAGWGDPALEFTRLPLRILPTVLEGYRTVAPLDGEETLRIRVRWNQLFRGLERVLRGPDVTSANHEDQPLSNWVEMLSTDDQMLKTTFPNSDPCSM